MIGTASSTLTASEYQSKFKDVVRERAWPLGRRHSGHRVHQSQCLGWIDYSGNFYTENATLTERWRLADYNTIDYELTVDDPKTFTQPWKMNFPKRRQGSGPVGRPLPPRGGPSAGSLGLPAHIQRADRWLAPCERRLRKRGLGRSVFRGESPEPDRNHHIGYKWFRREASPSEAARLRDNG